MEPASHEDHTHGVTSHAVVIIVVDVLFIVLALVAVVLRTWARRIKGRTLAFNDYAIFSALVRRTKHPASLLADVHAI